MNWNYENLIREKLSFINEDEQLGLKIEVGTEQVFTKLKTFSPFTTYIVIKYLSSDLSYGVKTQPIQIVAMSEENSLEKVKKLLQVFTEQYNFNYSVVGTTHIKQEYKSPVVLSNFNGVGAGERSILYVSGTLFLMENVADVKDLEIDGQKIQPLNFNINYAMTGNTQPVGSDELSSTVKNVSTLSISMSIPMIESNLVEKIVGIMSGIESGNSDFEFFFTLNGVEIEQDFKLISAQVITAPNSIPSLQLGFMR